MFRFLCEKCHQSIQVAEQQAGKLAKCPGCNSQTRVPDNAMHFLALTAEEKVQEAPESAEDGGISKKVSYWGMAIGAAMGGLIPLALWLERSPTDSPWGLNAVPGIAQFVLIGVGLGSFTRFWPVAKYTLCGALAALAIWFSQSLNSSSPASMNANGVLMFAALGACVGAFASLEKANRNKAKRRQEK